jgi:hypothetical protein
MVPGARSLLPLLQRGGERNDNPYRRNFATFLCKTYRAPVADGVPLILRERRE